MTAQENLELQIKTYDANYRAGTPICSDEAYDKLFDELKIKYPNSELLKKGVIPQKVSRKEKLPMAMFSLDKLKSMDEIHAWLRKCGIKRGEELVISAKYDGISLVVKEKTKQAWTRGDGVEGQNSTSHFSKVERDGTTDFDITTAGELILSNKNWNENFKGKINPYSGKPYTNARNTVAGFVGADDVRVELTMFDYIRYSLEGIESVDKSIQLENCNMFNSVNCNYVVIKVEELSERLPETLYQDWKSEYKIDGLVIDINCAYRRKNLGREENMNPAYARAIKFPEWSSSVDVKIIGLTWGVSKQGKLKPVINIEPTEIGGVEVSNVTGYNAAYVIDWHLVEGVNITVARSGDVIPKVIAVEGIKIPFREEFKNSGEFSLAYNEAQKLINKEFKTHAQLELAIDDLSYCPSCGEPTKWDETITEVVCTNPNCEEMNIAKLVHFFVTLGVEEFGEPSIRKFYEAGYKSMKNIIYMMPHNIINIEGFGESSATTILKQFDGLRRNGVSLAKLIHACDVMDGKLGEKTIQLILDNIEVEKLPHIATRVTVEELLHIDGVAETTATVFLAGYRRFLLLHTGVWISGVQSKKVEVTGNKFEGMKICFSTCRPSKEQEKEIQEQGGAIVSGVSGKTTHLVVKDMYTVTEKIKKAKDLGIKIINFNDLF